MSLQLSKLKEVFKSPPVSTESEAIDYITTKWIAFFADATTFGAPANALVLESIKPMMITAMTGISVPGAGADKLQDGITAFWAGVISKGPTIWVLSPPLSLISPPPGLSSIASFLQPVFNANTRGGLTADDSANALANAILSTQLGALATNTLAPTPLVSPIV